MYTAGRAYRKHGNNAHEVTKSAVLD